MRVHVFTCVQERQRARDGERESKTTFTMPSKDGNGIVNAVMRRTGAGLHTDTDILTVLPGNLPFIGLSDARDGKG